MLRFYVEVAQTAFRRQLIYRWANLAGMLANIVFGMIFSYVMIALFQVRSIAGGYDLRDALRYVWLVQSMVMIVLTFGWYDLMLTIRSGEVVSDLSKPCDFYWYWFSREIGRSGYYLLYRGLPTYLVGMLLFGFGAPLDWRLWLAFACSLPIGAMIGIAYRVLFNIAAFWIVEARAFGTLATVIALIFTGNYVPLPFFPAWLRAIADWLPFSGLMNVPAQIFLGKLAGGEMLLEFLRQLAWLLVMTLLVRFVAARATRRVVVQGG
ncbi:MAG TPA: ABC-2 family transporter protein [Ktedonobacteraceae bacterium]|nr:ABC-2 family transporter protein [Ktedonobacteraceae bacterium]